MNYLSVELLSKSFGTLELFSEISFGVNQGEKVALIARNGHGKTTLLNILKGKEIADSGKFSFNKDIVVSFLDQEINLNNNISVLEEVFASENEVIQAVKKHEECLVKYNLEPTENNLKLLSESTSTIDNLNAWSVEARAKEILSRLKVFIPDRKIGELSGGEKKRVCLAKVLLSNPDFLILDEPTNHLDLEMIEWLEDFLFDSQITLLLVTHDRYFLDNVCDRIIELDKKSITSYSGNYQQFLYHKAEKEKSVAAEIDKAKNIYRKELEWVRRMPKARTTKAKYRVKAFDSIEEKAHSYQTERNIQLNVRMSRLGTKIIELENLSKSFDDRCLFANFSYIFRKGEKIGIIGKNGSGKTTLLDILMNKQNPDTGTVVHGETVVFGYYTQAGIKFKSDQRVIDIVKEIAEFIPLADGNSVTAAQLLFKFQFTAEKQYSLVSKLSGGEKRKLYLLTILMKNPNFLILDEPTNDLDIETLTVLEDFLISYTGCIIVVSHDRYFMDKIADHIFSFEENSIIKDYPGNYSQYREKKAEEQELKPSVNKPAQRLVSEIPVKPVVKTKKTYKERLEFEKLETELSELEREKSNVAEKMNSQGLDHLQVTACSERYSELSLLIDQKTDRWLELSELE